MKLFENGLRFIRDSIGIRSEEDVVDHLFAAYLFEIPILDSWDDPEHWFSKTPSGEPVDAFYDRDISVSVKDGERIAEGTWWGKKVVLCKRFSLTLAGYGTKEVREDAFINGAFWIIDRPLHDHYPIDQAFYFQTEGGGFRRGGIRERDGKLPGADRHPEGGSLRPHRQRDLPLQRRVGRPSLLGCGRKRKDRSLSRSMTT